LKKENESHCSAPQGSQYLEETVSGEILCLAGNSGGESFTVHQFHPEHCRIPQVLSCISKNNYSIQNGTAAFPKLSLPT